MPFFAAREIREGVSMRNFMRVSSGSMRKDIEEIREEAERIPQAVNELAESLNALSSCWKGPAKSTYLEQVQTDIEYMKEVCSMLQKYLDDFAASREEYDTCENKVYDRLGKLHFGW